MQFQVTIHKQTTSVVEIASATSADDAITQAQAGSGTTLSQTTVSVQFVPQQMSE